MNRKKRNLNNTVKKHRNKVRKVRTRGKHKKARLSRKHKSTQKLRRSMNNLAGSLEYLGPKPKTSILDKILTIARRKQAPSTAVPGKKPFVLDERTSEGTFVSLLNPHKNGTIPLKSAKFV